MNLTQLQAKLLAAARKSRPSDHVPYAFEKRIMAHLTRPITDVWALWGRALWRAALSCVAAMLLVGGWSFQTSSSNDTTDLAEDFENTVFAGLDEPATPDVGEDIW